VKYLDRFLMFYIRTADALTRTATWLNKMEGGMSYLKNVIVNDSLGLGGTWEQEMQSLVDVYTCEWKEVVDNPELRRRFVHFVNAPRKKDPELEFGPLRGQVKAQEW
jgi:nitrite reductase (NADH) large subunit